MMNAGATNEPTTQRQSCLGHKGPRPAALTNEHRLALADKLKALVYILEYHDRVARGYRLGHWGQELLNELLYRPATKTANLAPVGDEDPGDNYRSYDVTEGDRFGIAVLEAIDDLEHRASALLAALEGMVSLELPRICRNCGTPNDDRHQPCGPEQRPHHRL